jgi:hypothetical protein
MSEACRTSPVAGRWGIALVPSHHPPHHPPIIRLIVPLIIPLIVPKMLFLIPLVRFPGLVWLIAVGLRSGS